MNRGVREVKYERAVDEILDDDCLCRLAAKFCRPRIIEKRDDVTCAVESCHDWLEVLKREYSSDQCRALPQLLKLWSGREDVSAICTQSIPRELGSELHGAWSFEKTRTAG